MSNMSYCRFQNTLIDLRDCIYVLEDEERRAELSAEEKRAAKVMLHDILDLLNTLDIIPRTTREMEMDIDKLFEEPAEEDEEEDEEE